MLSLLHIENIALIETADIRFGPGFNALTGETGAGKSIVIDSISAVLGERTSRDLIRTGASSAYVSAIFCCLPNLEWFETSGIHPDENDELLLERELHGDGRNICHVNGRPLTVTQLRMLGQQLLNIHGQHDGQQLLNEEYHLDYLDRFGDTQTLLQEYRKSYQNLVALQREISALQMDETEKSRRLDTLDYQISELESADLKLGEDRELSEKRSLFRSAGKLMDALETVVSALDGSGEVEGAVGLLSTAAGAAAQAARTVGGDGINSQTLESISERLDQMQSDAFDVLEVARELQESLDISQTDIDQMESRLDLLYRLGKKYGATTEDMLAYLEKCRSEREQIQYSDDRISALQCKLPACISETERCGKALSAVRHQAAESLKNRISQELADLDMPRVRFEVQFQPIGGELGMDATGMNQVCFLMSANLGEELKPIHRIASGGELSRIMLALKNVLAESDDVSTMVFDEIDTGISGRAAVKVAQKMAQVSRQKQILCVTHLPQIAAMADTHFHVQKQEYDNRTYTEVKLLSDAERSAELGRLTGGEAVTHAMLESASELLQESKKYKDLLKEGKT